MEVPGDPGAAAPRTTLSSASPFLPMDLCQLVLCALLRCLCVLPLPEPRTSFKAHLKASLKPPTVLPTVISPLS